MTGGLEQLDLFAVVALVTFVEFAKHLRGGDLYLLEQDIQRALCYYYYFLSGLQMVLAVLLLLKAPKLFLYDCEMAKSFVVQDLVHNETAVNVDYLYWLN